KLHQSPETHGSFLPIAAIATRAAVLVSEAREAVKQSAPDQRPAQTGSKPDVAKCVPAAMIGADRCYILKSCGSDEWPRVPADGTGTVHEPANNQPKTRRVSRKCDRA
ncbi:hypothetical protein, partial [Mesorhizobium sp. M8A.F.Ca.ET.213.01.1.1]|uniref:hypothetical protein n=1 Tax=Mesorhizobium sp. M8A.F.Ca.ET.213.01.1.1 TaxID=2563970 RepID=UPI001AEDB127